MPNYMKHRWREVTWMTSDNRKVQTGFQAAAKRVVKSNKLLTGTMLALILCAILFALLPPLVLERIVNHLTEGRYVAAWLAALYFGTLAAAGLFEAFQNITITVFGQKITHGVRKAMCEKLNRLPAAYFTEHEAGKITSRFVNDVDAVDALFTNGIISMFADGCQVISIIGVIFWKSTGLGILMLLITPLLFGLTRVFQKRMLKAQMANRAAVGKVNNHIPETIRNIRMIRTLFRQKYMEERYDNYIEESYHAMEKANVYDSLYSPIIIFISSCVIAGMMILSARGGGMQEFFGMSVGTAVAVIAYVGKVFTPLESIGMEIQNIQSAVAGVRRIDELLRESERWMPEEIVSNHAGTIPEDERGIRFEHVTFGYDADKPILEDVSFTVAHGEYATLIGRTGAGKSTVFRLLLGLYQPDSGVITIGGTDAGRIPDAGKRKLFGYVEQSFKLLAGTVAEQITLFDETISREQIEKAARLAGLHESILALERGYDTIVTESTFSQGQLQLLSIARAVAAEPEILLLDEITANLDSDTERRVMEALENASKNRTVLSISHRLYERSMAGKLISIGEL